MNYHDTLSADSACGMHGVLPPIAAVWFYVQPLPGLAIFANDLPVRLPYERWRCSRIARSARSPSRTRNASMIAR
jgi:hypothetical protein